MEAAGVLGARDGSIRLVVASAASKVEFEEVIAHWGDEWKRKIAGVSVRVDG